jgi:hypothetical protein
MPTDYSLIEKLIVKRYLGVVLTEAEDTFLERWQQLSPHNKALADRFADQEWVGARMHQYLQLKQECPSQKMWKAICEKITFVKEKG